MKDALNELVDSAELLGQSFLNALPGLFIAALLMLLVHVIGRSFRNRVTRGARFGSLNDNAALVIGRLVYAGCIAGGLLVSLMVTGFGFHLNDLVQLLGIGGVALSFAFRDILQNFLAGYVLLLSRSLLIGDDIRIGEHVGTIEDVQTRVTVIRSVDGRRILVPNSMFFSEIVSVNSHGDHVRDEIELPLSNELDLDTVRGELVKGILEVAGVVDEPAPTIRISGLADGALTCVVRWWVDPQVVGVLQVKNDVVANIYATVGTQLTFPITQ